MDKTPGIAQSYEILTQDIFQTILDQGDVRNIRVEHDVKLQGTTTSHQIDVYWKFVLGGVTYETVVQAKGWNERVDQGKLLEFKGVLDDLQGQPRGIFVTRKGYQAGAKKFAAAHGIILYELDEAPSGHHITMTSLGWAKVEVKVLRLKASTDDNQHSPEEETAFGRKYTVFQPQLSNIKHYLDESWCRAHLSARRFKHPLTKSRLRLRPSVVSHN